MEFQQIECADFEAILAKTFDNYALYCYAIIDCAQDASLLTTFKKERLSIDSKCLLPAALETDLEHYAPHLVAMSPLAADSPMWPDILKGGARRPASFTLLASELGFASLWKHLSAWTEVLLPDDTDMILAYWDPAILGTLTGQKSDLTLHVPVAALPENQRGRLLQDISAWWYWDRDGNPQQVLPRVNQYTEISRFVDLPLKLRQFQVDMLVEAGVPDMLLSLLKQNQPQLLLDIPPAEHYRIVKKHLFNARRLKLEGVRDMLNYICAALIYGEAMQSNPNVRVLLEDVRAGKTSFEAAMSKFP